MGEPEVLPLVQLAVAGNREAFDEIVFLYRDQVYATAWQLTRNTDDAMDVSQEVFMRAFRALSSYKGRAKFSTWLHRIVLNSCIDHIRREKRHWGNISLSEVPDDGTEDTQAPPPEGTVDPRQRESVYQKQIQRRILSGLEQISARQRDVFVLRYYQDLELKEIADVLKCSDGAVKRHLHRAQMRLRDILRDIRPI
ncbi:MAG: RNA polymerase sigma factor [Candidatus Sumerlaeaceae bacterium]